MTGPVMKLLSQIFCTEKYSRMEHISRLWIFPHSKSNILLLRDLENAVTVPRRMRVLRSLVNIIPIIRSTSVKEGTSSQPYVKMVQISSRDYLNQLTT